MTAMLFDLSGRKSNFIIDKCGYYPLSSLREDLKKSSRTMDDGRQMMNGLQTDEKNRVNTRPYVSVWIKSNNTMCNIILMCLLM